MSVAHRDVAGLLKKHGYSQVRKIGEGSFGKAILVRHNDSEKEFVCKMVDVSKASAKEAQDAVKEGKLLAQFKHPYIVRYRENFIESGWLCIVMDYCEGGELGKKIQEAKKSRQNIPEDQVLRWLTQAVLALKYIHDKHILHRDLKPGNFFISKSGSLKMGDFGIAKVLSSTLACARTQIGTPYYLSPEVCQEKPYAWASDIWAMGCILYEMCALKVPFDATSIPSLVQKICRGPVPQIPQSYSDFTRQLCNEMLNRNPNSRPSPDDILQRPKIQSIVRQMLDEAQASQGMLRLGSDDSDKASVADAMPPPLAAAQDRGRNSSGEKARNYEKGDLVWYYSTSHKDWLPAAINDVDSSGAVVIDLKPSTWISVADQLVRMRPRKQAEPNAARAAEPNLPRAAAYSPMYQRSPSVGALQRERKEQPARGASPLRGRSPSVDALRRHSPSPSIYRNAPFGRENSDQGAGSRAPSPRRGFSPYPGAGAGSRCQTPSRVPSPLNGGAAQRPGQKPISPSQIRPPCMPKPDSPPFRRNAALAAAGMGIVGN